MACKLSKIYLIHFVMGKVFKCVLTYNYYYNSVRRDYCSKYTKKYFKEFLAKVPMLGFHANPSFSSSKSFIKLSLEHIRNKLWGLIILRAQTVKHIYCWLTYSFITCIFHNLVTHIVTR